MRGGRSNSNATCRPVRLAKTLRSKASTQARFRSANAGASEPRFSKSRNRASPVSNSAWRMQSPTFPKRFGKAMRFGTYFRIIEEGEVEAGSPMVFERAAPEPTLPSRDVARIYMFDHAEKQKLAAIPALALHWRSWGAGYRIDLWGKGIVASEATLTVMEPVLLDRLQFAFTIMFHYLFPIGTMGLAPFVAWLHLARIDAAMKRRRAPRASGRRSSRSTSRSASLPAFRWSFSSARTGRCFRRAAARSSVSRSRWKACSRSSSSRSFSASCSTASAAAPTRCSAASAVLVWLGSWLSGFFIVATDAWMQHPVGYALAPMAASSSRDIWARALLSRSRSGSIAHVLVRRDGRRRLHRRRHRRVLSARERDEAARRDVSCEPARSSRSSFSVLAVFPTGDRNGDDVTHVPAGQARRDGRPIRIDARRAAGDHRHAGHRDTTR